MVHTRIINNNYTNYAIIQHQFIITEPIYIT